MAKSKRLDGVYIGTKLTGVDVEMIREVLDLCGREANQRELAKEFSVHYTLISHIKRKIRWKETRA